MSKTLSVEAIESGTVIDHISKGQAIRIVHLLHLLNQKHQVTIGLNLPSARMGLKDIIKIENHVLTNMEANDIMIFAPDATINIIRNFEVINKILTTLPTTISHIFTCPNTACITQSEPVDTFFYIEAKGNEVSMTCKYCQHTFDRNEVKMNVSDVYATV